METFASGTCFGADCIQSFPEILKTLLSSVQACDQFLQFIKGIIQVEEVYGRSLEKLSIIPIEPFSGSLHDCLLQLKSDTNHKSVQHLHFAENLSKEIYVPIMELRNLMECKVKEISGQYYSMQQEIRDLEGTYKKRYHTFQKSYNDAFMSIAQWKLRERTSSTSNSRILEETNSFISSFATSFPPSLVSFATKSKGNDLLQWVVAPLSADQNDPQSFLTVLSSKVAKADKQRLLTRKSWIEYIITSHRYSLRVQILITKMQGLLESFIVTLQDQMRKMAVFESSSLANQQYDVNMLFKSMEKIDVRGDLLNLIHKTKKSSTQKQIWVSDIFGSNLAHISALPLPPTNLTLTLDISEKPHYIDPSTVARISNIMLLKKKEIFSAMDPIQNLGMYDGSLDTPPCDPCDASGSEEWYECSDDAMNQLVCLQNSLRQHWLDVINTFNADDSPVTSRNVSLLEVADEKLDSDDENCLEESYTWKSETSSPSSNLDSNNVESIISSWGLLDVHERFSSDDPSSQYPDSVSSTTPSHEFLDLHRDSLL